MVLLFLLLLLDNDLRALACSFAKSGARLPNDEIHGRLFRAAASSPYPVGPRPLSTVNNAFVPDNLLDPIPELTGNDKPLIDVLAEFAATEGEELCYWSFQGLPPPRGGPSTEHPFRGYWDVPSGQYDEDMEWVYAYGTVAVSRLGRMIEKDGPVVSAMGSFGGVLSKRRCDISRASGKSCIPAITNAKIAWPMAISLWKVGHPELREAVQMWRGSALTGHLPNIMWVSHFQRSNPHSFPYNGSDPKPGEILPKKFPTGSPAWPVSKDMLWGTPKIAKVVKCSEVPEKYMYQAGGIDDTDGNRAAPDEAYDVWKSLVGTWPPTKPCVDDLAALNQILKELSPLFPTMGSCSQAYEYLQEHLPNFDCDNVDTIPAFRVFCCSACGQRPVPVVSPPSPSPPASHQCAVCNHVYDAARDGNGKRFEDLPDSWNCPVCGVPKRVYRKAASGEWFHEEPEGSPGVVLVLRQFFIVLLINASFQLWLWLTSLVLA